MVHFRAGSSLKNVTFIRLCVNGQNHRALHILAITSVNNVEKNASVLCIKVAVPKLINNKAGRFYEALDDPFNSTALSCMN